MFHISPLSSKFPSRWFKQEVSLDLGDEYTYIHVVWISWSVHVIYIYISVVISLKNRGVCLCGGVPKCIFFPLSTPGTLPCMPTGVAMPLPKAQNSCVCYGETCCTVKWLCVEVWNPIYSLIACHLSTFQGEYLGWSHMDYTHRVKHLYIFSSRKAYVACTS